MVFECHLLLREAIIRINLICFDHSLDHPHINVKLVHFGHVHFSLFAPVNARVKGKALSLYYHAIVVFEQLILFIKGSFPH